MIKVSDVFEGVEIETLGGTKDILKTGYEMEAGLRGKVYKDHACQWMVRLGKSEWNLAWFQAGSDYFGLKLVE